MKKILLALVAIACSLSMASTGFSYTLQGYPVSIKSPEELVGWLHKEFTYELKFPDYKQTLDETLKRRAGDCEDFALLSHTVLNGLGIKNEVVIVTYREIKVMHAICVFKHGNTYSIISNREMIKTSRRSVNDAIAEIYPDWDKLAFLSSDGQPVRTIERDYTLRIGRSTLAMIRSTSETGRSL